MKRVRLFAFWLFAGTLTLYAQRTFTVPPAAFFELVPTKYREGAKAFYKKYLDVSGLPVLASGEVADTFAYEGHTDWRLLKPSGAN